MALKNDFFCVSITEDEKIIDLNIENKTIPHDRHLKEFAQCVKDISKIERNSKGCLKRMIVSQTALNCVEQWLDKTLNEMLHNVENKEIFDIATEIFRFLRNCATDSLSQQYVLESTNILNIVEQFFTKIFETNKTHLCLKVLLQFLINMISSNKEAGEEIFELFYCKVRKCLDSNINLYECSALIYYISLIKQIDDVELICTALDLYSSSTDNEFLVFFLENTLSDDKFWTTYKDLHREYKILTFEVLKNTYFQNNSFHLPCLAVELITEEFLKNAGCIFQLAEAAESEQEAYEVSLLLEILSSLSGKEVYRKQLQNNRNILVNAGALLLNIHRLGKEGDNCFTPVQKLMELKTDSGLNEHPAFGFKADLVRLIGNLCWKNADLQNLARTADLIPVILECCNIDARNPFISQWSILAIRNLCEKNSENQKIIAGLHREGTVTSEALNEMGITLHSSEEGELKIVSLESLREN